MTHNSLCMPEIHSKRSGSRYGKDGSSKGYNRIAAIASALMGLCRLPLRALSEKEE